MRVRVGGDLRQVGDAQHLPALPQGVQQAADGVGDFTTDAAVDFVEDDGRGWGFVEAGDFDGKADAREFAAGGNFRQRLQGLAGVGAEGVGDVVCAVRSRARGGGDVDGKGGFVHAELADPVFDFVREFGCSLLARGAEGGGAFAVGGFGSLAGGGELAAVFVFCGQCRVFVGEFLPVRRQVSGVAMVFAREAVQGAHAFFDGGQGFGVVFDFVQLFVEGVAGFVEVNDGLFEQFGGFLEGVAGGGEVVDFTQGLAQGGFQVVVAFAQLGAELAAFAEDFVGSGKQALPLGQGAEFVRLRRDVLDFFKLVGEQGQAFFLRGAVLLPVLLLFFEGLPVAVGFGASSELVVVSAVAVEAAALFVVFE